jgi:carboxypeptidase C (cathepsin A)
LIIGQDSIFLKRRFPQQIKSRLNIPYETHAGGHMFPLEYPESVSQQVLSLIEQQLPT